MFFKKVFVLTFLFSSTIAAPVLAVDPVSMYFQNKSGSYEVEGDFQVAADCAVVWSVLTDYDDLHQFVGSLKRSHLEEYWGKNRFLVEQEFEGGFLFVTKRMRVRLDVREIRCKTILFEDVGRQDFEFYKGSWKLGADPDGELTVFYSLKAQQNFDEPFAGNYMKGVVKDLLDSVRREILRRQALNAVVHHPEP